jgi:hypothetical protein
MVAFQLSKTKITNPSKIYKTFEYVINNSLDFIVCADFKNLSVQFLIDKEIKALENFMDGTLISTIEQEIGLEYSCLRSPLVRDYVPVRYSDDTDESYKKRLKHCKQWRMKIEIIEQVFELIYKFNERFDFYASGELPPFEKMMDDVKAKEIINKTYENLKTFCLTKHKNDYILQRLDEEIKR